MDDVLTMFQSLELYSRKEKKESGRGLSFFLAEATQDSQKASPEGFSLSLRGEGQVREKKSYFFSDDGGSPENGVPAERGASGARTYTPTRTRI